MGVGFVQAFAFRRRVMRTHYTYWYENGAIWRWTQTGILKARMDAVYVDRDFAAKLCDQHAESAEIPDYFRRRAIELRDEMAEAIRQYDEQFQQPNMPHVYGNGKETTYEYHLQES